LRITEQREDNFDRQIVTVGFGKADYRKHTEPLFVKYGYLLNYSVVSHQLT